ncbi:MAG: hypothetical protein C3F07_14410 [Anaerolineales bacterium]|nr:hypothetical protein [Anaerolineae bacterium]PWB71298.1 MAG: hypothetical protein C3F07_14410 [Anaerolineales bacterium]
MEILGIGASELVFVIIIALIVLGPKDMQKAGRTIGKWLRTIVTSDGWKTFQQTSREIRNLPNRLMREANEDLEKINRDINKSMDMKTGPTSPPRSRSMDSLRPVAPKPDPNLPPSNEPENTIQPPAAKPTDNETDTDTDKEKHD